MDSQPPDGGGDLPASTARYREAAARDPRDFVYGYVAGDPATGAAGPFLWFATPEALLTFLRTVEVSLLGFDEDDAQRIAAALARVVASTRDLARIDRAALSAAFAGWSQILWIGTFPDLCSKGGAWSTGLRAAFRVEHGLGEHPGPIGDDEQMAFVGYLRGLCPVAT
jgi:hypothetical protein